ncbi:hypothetical protein HK405_015812, partial [Cladochytrium tenue]
MSAVQQPLAAPHALGHDHQRPHQPRSHDSVGPIDAAAVLAAISAANLSPVYPSASSSSARSGKDSATCRSGESVKLCLRPLTARCLDSTTVVSSVLAASEVGSNYSVGSSVVIKEYVAHLSVGATSSPLRNVWPLASSDPQAEDTVLRSVSLETVRQDDCDAEDAQSAHVVPSSPSISPQFVHASSPAGVAPSCAVSTGQSGQIRPVKFPIMRRGSRRLPVAQRAAVTFPAVSSLHALDTPRSSSSTDADSHLWCGCHPVRGGGLTFSGPSRAFSEDLPPAGHLHAPSRPRRQSEGGLRASQPRAAGGHWWQRVLVSLKNLRLKRKVRERAEEGGDIQQTLEAHLVSMAEAATTVEPDGDASDTAAAVRWNSIFPECEDCQGTQFLLDGTVCQDCIELTAGDGVPERPKFPLEFVRSPSSGPDPVLEMLRGDTASVSSSETSSSGRPVRALAVWDMTRVASRSLGMVGAGADSGAGAMGGANPIARAVQRLKPKQSIDSPPPSRRSLSLSSSSSSLPPRPRRGSHADVRDNKLPRSLAPPAMASAAATASPDSPAAWSARLALFSPRDLGRSLSFGSLSSIKHARAADSAVAASPASAAGSFPTLPPPERLYADGEETSCGAGGGGRRPRPQLVSMLLLEPATDGTTCVGPDSGDDDDNDESGDERLPPALRRSATLPAPVTPTTRVYDSDGSTLASVPRS